MASEESFRQNGPWIESSVGFKVRSRGRVGLEYIRGQLRLDLDAEALASPGFVVYPGVVPEELREQILDDVARAWRWAGFSVEILDT